MTGFLRHGGNGPCSVTVRVGQVLGDFSVQTELLDELDEHGMAPCVCADQLDVMCRARSEGLEVELLDGCVDGFFSHGSVSRPFTTCDRHQPGFRSVDHVVSDKRLSVCRVGVSNQRSKTGPGGKDITSSDLDIGRQVLSDFIQDPLDLFFLGQRMLFDGRGRVRSTGDDVSLPRQEEDDSSVRSVGVEETHALWSVVVGQGDVHTGRGSHNLGDLLIVEFSESVGEWSGSVDETLSTNGVSSIYTGGESICSPCT